MSNLTPRETIRAAATKAFRDHRILKRTDTSVTVGREGTSIERFTFYDLPHGTLFAGDLGSAFIPNRGLAWLKQNADNPEYVGEKLAALEGERRVYSQHVTMTALDELPEAYGEFTSEEQRDLDELKISVMDADSQYTDPLFEVERLYAGSSFFDGEMLRFWDWSPRLYWLLEAAACLARLEAGERAAA